MKWALFLIEDFSVLIKLLTRIRRCIMYIFFSFKVEYGGLKTVVILNQNDNSWSTCPALKWLFWIHDITVRFMFNAFNFRAILTSLMPYNLIIQCAIYLSPLLICKVPSRLIQNASTELFIECKNFCNEMPAHIDSETPLKPSGKTPFLTIFFLKKLEK